jgi:hypothetical protein
MHTIRRPSAIAALDMNGFMDAEKKLPIDFASV